LRPLYCFKILRATRKSYDHTKHLSLGDSSRQGAKSAK
jgi:hypothetical protein